MRPKLFCNAAVSSFFFSHRCILLLLHSNIRISVPSVFGVNDQNKNGQQSCSNKSKCLSSPNISSVHQNVLRWYQLCNRVLRIKKKKLLNNWVKALTNVAITGHRASKKNLELVNMPYDMELVSTLGYFSSKYPGISKQSISDFKKVY